LSSFNASSDNGEDNRKDSDSNRENGTSRSRDSESKSINSEAEETIKRIEDGIVESFEKGREIIGTIGTKFFERIGKLGTEIEKIVNENKKTK
jgi:hypothetical protein